MVSNTEFTLTYEALGLLYLTVCMYVLRDGPTHGHACALSPRFQTVHFIVAVMWPTVLFRLVAYMRYKNRDYNSMVNCLFFINGFWNVAYGIWTIMNVLKISEMSFQKQCNPEPGNLLELNYEVVIFFGIFPALVTAFFSIVLVLCFPYLIYLIYKNRT